MREYVVPVETKGNWYGPPLEEIVRCRDCVNYVKDPNPIDPGWPMMCELTGMDMVSPNDFCCWGERREK